MPAWLTEFTNIYDNQLIKQMKKRKKRKTLRLKPWNKQ